MIVKPSSSVDLVCKESQSTSNALILVKAVWTNNHTLLALSTVKSMIVVAWSPVLLQLLDRIVDAAVVHYCNLREQVGLVQASPSHLGIKAFVSNLSIDQITSSILWIWCLVIVGEVSGPGVGVNFVLRDLRIVQA